MPWLHCSKSAKKRDDDVAHRHSRRAQFQVQNGQVFPSPSCAGQDHDGALRECRLWERLFIHSFGLRGVQDLVALLSPLFPLQRFSLLDFSTPLGADRLEEKEIAPRGCHGSPQTIQKLWQHVGSRGVSRFFKPNRPRTAHSVCARFFASQFSGSTEPSEPLSLARTHHPSERVLDRPLKLQNWLGCWAGSSAAASGCWRQCCCGFVACSAGCCCWLMANYLLAGLLFHFFPLFHF